MFILMQVSGLEFNTRKNPLHTFNNVENKTGIFIGMKVDHVTNRAISQRRTVHRDIVLTHSKYNSMVN